MNDERSHIREELLAERELSIPDYWQLAEGRLDWPISVGLNLAHECCDRWASDRARIALSVHGPDGNVQRWTYDELMRASKAVSNILVESGLKPGDRFAALLDQQVESYICALGAWRAGMVYVPLFVGFGADALVQRLEGADVSAVVVDWRYRDVYAKVSRDLTAEPRVLTVAGPQGRGIMPGDASLWQEITLARKDFDTVVTSPEDPATLIYTSGTTGDPKGCLHPHSLLLPLQSFLRHVMALGKDDVVFGGANPGWSFGLYTAGLGIQSLGISRVIYTGGFDPAAWLRVFAAERVTYVATAPSAYRSLIDAANKTGLPDSVRGGLSAGEPLTKAVTTGWNKIGGGALQDGYGSSEIGMVLANLAYDDRDIPVGSLSSHVPGFDVALVDENGTPQKSEGIIAVRDAKWPIIGYRNLPGVWEAKTRGDYFLSGDLARKDADGYYWFAGRSDDLIVTAGYNVGPTEVENIISGLDGVQDVAVVAAPDKNRGSVVRAVVVDDRTIAREILTNRIQDAVRSSLGRHAYPKIIDFVDALPRTETGKIRRNVLRDEARTTS